MWVDRNAARRGRDGLFRGQPWLKGAVCGLALLGSGSAWSVAAYLSHSEEKAAISAAVAQNVMRVVAIEQYVRRTLDAADLAMLAMVRLQEQELLPGRAPRAGITRLSDLQAGGHFWTGISIADRKGRVVATTVDGLPRIDNVEDHPAFRVHANGSSSGLYVNVPTRSASGEHQLWVTRRIDGSDGNFAGVVGVNLPAERLTQLVSRGELGAADLVSVIGLDGVTRARRTGDRFTAGEDLRGKAVMERQLRAPSGTYRGPSALDGRIRYFSHRRLPEYGLFVTSGVLEDDVLAPVRQRMRLYHLVAALFTLLSLVCAVFFLTVMHRRRRLVQGISEANRRLVQAQRLGGIGDWRWDLVTGRTEWSDALLEMYGREPGSRAPSFAEFLDMLDEESRAIVQHAHRRIQETRQPQRFAFTVRATGRETHHESYAVPVLENGQVIRIEGTDRDVTAAHELERVRAKLAQASRIGAMNAMASTLAHELNQPLAAARNYLNGSRRMALGVTNPLLHEGMMLAEQQISFAGQIIRRIRAMVKDQSRTPERVFLADAWRNAANLVQAADLDSSFVVAAAFDLQADTVFADRVQLEQVFINLLRNALAVTEAHPDRQIVARSRSDGEELVQITVCDNGPGFPTFLDNPFAAFAGGSRGGLGLGLSISRTIVEAHGGRIWAEREGELTCVHFTLPAYPVRFKEQPFVRAAAL